MATRILTLFDDDFFEQENPEPSRTTVVKEATGTGKEPLNKEKSVPDNIQEPAPSVPADEPEVILHKELPPAVLPGTGELAQAVSEDKAPESAVDDQKELDKQMRTELIQLDYTTLIHRELPVVEQKSQAPAFPDKEITLTPANTAAIQFTSFPEPEENTEEAVTAPEDENVEPLPEWDLDKNYYTIGEVARLFSVNTSHIRFWTNEFKLKPRTNRKGDRLYSPKDIAELRLIYHLVKEKKHTIKGAREKLKVQKEGVGQQVDLKEALTGLKKILVDIKEQL